MTQQLVYTGPTEPFYEVAITGRQRSWYRNNIQDVPDAAASLLLAAGVGFSVNPSDFTQAQKTALQALLVSGAGNIVTLTPGASPVSVPFSYAQADFGIIYVAAALSLVASSTGAVRNGSIMATVVADGTNAPTLTGMVAHSSDAGYVNTSGVVNTFTAWYDGLKYYYSWSQDAALSPVSAPDTTPPSLSAAAVNGASLTLTYNETLTATAPATSAYSVVGAGGITQAPSAVSISGAVVTLTLATPAVNGNTVAITYAVPGSNPVKDAAGNAVAALSSQAVTNNTAAADTTPPTLSSAAVNGSTLTLVYSEALNTTAPAASAYSVVGAGGVTQTPSAVSIASATVTLTLTTPAVSGNTVTVSYTVPGSNPVRDTAGNSAVALTSQAVTNNTSASGFAFLRFATLAGTPTVIETGDGTIGWAYGGTSGDATSTAIASNPGVSIPINTDFEYIATLTDGATSTNNGVIAMANGVGAIGYSVAGALYAMHANGGFRQFTAGTLGSTGGSSSAGAWMRLKRTNSASGTNATVTWDYSTNSGSSWTTLATATAQSAGTVLYPNCAVGNAGKVYAPRINGAS